MPRGKGLRAWLVLWDGSGEHPAVEPKVAAILPWQWTAERVGQLVEVLYASGQYEPSDMLEALRPGGNKPYQYTTPGRSRLAEQDGTAAGWTDGAQQVVCGGNPSLIARQARVWDLDDASGAVGWEYLPPRLANRQRRSVGVPYPYMQDAPYGDPGSSEPSATTGR